MVKVNLLSCAFVLIYLLQYFFVLWIARLNIRRIRGVGSDVPEAFKGFVDADKLAAINAYTRENIRFALIRKTVFDVFLLLLILGGVLPWFDGRWITPRLHYLLAGTIFFVSIAVVLFMLELPFDWYASFMIEQKYGFNRSTLPLWVTDNLKALVLQIGLVIALMIPLLWSIRLAPNYWWFWAFVLVSLVELCLIVLYPILIAPLFNKFEPIADVVLAESIRQLAGETGMKTKGIFQMDAGKRSSHTNAYFTGIGRTKRVVLFDTLIDSHGHREILAVLAHELGHFKQKHVVKTFIGSAAATLVGFYLTYRLMGWELLYQTFGFEQTAPYAALFVIGIFGQRIGFFLKPVYMAVSRRFERQADAYAAKMLGTSQPLVTALKRLARDNLANINPHPFYVWFNYSHPPLLERIKLLEDEFLDNRGR